MSIPESGKTWTVEGDTGFDCLVLNEQSIIPQPSENEVLVKFHAASLNYRDICIPQGKFPFGFKKGIVPGSDGAGEVVLLGSKVTRFHKGDKVVTLFNQGHLDGSLDPKLIATTLGGFVDGTLRQYGTFNENGLVTMPESLSWTEGAAIPAAGLSAWNALYGLKPLKCGDYVLTQGTGGVSLFALQFAKAAGAKVIATTSSTAKVEQLKALGADHIINYMEVENWGEEAKKFTPGAEGVDHVVEIGGPTTMTQSLKAIKIDGLISVVGWLGGDAEKEPGFLECINHLCTVRGLYVGSRLMFEEMNRAIDANSIKPVVDTKVFKFEDLKEAYQYMWEKKHVGKICVTME